MAKKSSLEEFKNIGKQRKPEQEIYERKIHFDKRQYSLKIPKNVMDKIGYEEGDLIQFIINKPYKSLKDFEIKFVKNGKKRV